jgi:maltose alpha-D-glucosyltransferase/alpha-amylase
MNATPAADPLWYKDAVIYELHIKAFFDANGDGIGDFAGLIEKLDYVRDLGVNTIWLLPFYPSPFRDDGYDVADFMNVHPAYGSTADVARLVQAAHARGLRVITELVVNHSSDQHPWFQAARRAPRGSPERDFYVWSDDPKKYAGTRIIFTDTEKSNWTWDELAGQYYWHRFFSHQPDLNFDNPAVREAVFGVMAFWLEQGVDGFRLDAIPYLVEREGTGNENLRETHEVIKELRRRLDARWPGKLLLAEANMWPEDVREYFGDDDECHMAYHFPLMPRMYMAIAQEDRHPVVEILAQTPDISPACQWAIFLRNHDELTLEMVTSKERDYMYSMYAADPRARINLGIRRRLAPLLENDLERIKLMNSLLLSMPGSPVLYYGDEIGMGDNIFLGDRDGVRTPMQWSSDRNGGYSRADPQRLYLPPIQDPVYGYEAVNVEAQTRDTSSLLHWTRRLLAVRRSTQVFGRGRITMLHPGNRKVLAYLRELGAEGAEGGEAVLCVANLSRSAQPVELDLARFKGRVPVEMGGHIAFPPVGDRPYLLTLPGYGFFWFRLATDVAPPDWHTHRLPAEDLAVLVLFDGWNSLFRDRVVPWRIAMATQTLARFEGELLPRFLARQRWFAAGTGPLRRVRVAEHAELAHGGRTWLLTLLEAPGTPPGPTAMRWFAPWALAWEDGESGASGEDERLRRLAPVALAKVRMQARVGVLADAAADPAFGRALVQAIGARLELRTAHGLLRFTPGADFAAIAGADASADSDGPVPTYAWPQGHHATAQVGARLFLKLLRRVQPGINAEAEMARHLHEVAHFEHSVPLAGSVEYAAADGAVSTLALLQAYVPNQGNAWNLTVEQLARQLDRAATAGTPAGTPGGDEAVEAGFLAGAQTLALRTADLHAALARHSGDAAFDPEPLTAADVQRWVAATRAQTSATLGLLRQRAGQLAAPQQALALQLAAAAPALERVAAAAAAWPPAGWKTRIHGGYRLQELLRVHNDFVIVDFEGDAESPPEARRLKQSPLRDVARMLRSIDQAREAALAIGAHAEADRLRREAQAASWEGAVREAFLQAYAAAAVDHGGCASLAAFEAARPLLRLFEIDLALQQLRDELEGAGAPSPSAPSPTAAAGLAALARLLQAT